jgi:hypothetical protein
LPQKARTVSTKIKVRKHREQLRREGLRPLQLWVPDVLSSPFRAAARKQSKAVAAGERAGDLAFLAAISDLDLGQDRD